MQGTRFCLFDLCHLCTYMYTCIPDVPYMYKVGMYLKHNVLEKREYKIMIGFPEKNVTTYPHRFHWF